MPLSLPDACQVPTPPPHTSLISMDLREGGLAKFECNSGYRFATGDDVQSTQCQNSFAWTEGPAQCIGKNWLRI